MEKNSNKKVVFLCSGGGGNLRFIDLAIKKRWIRNVTIVTVITDRHCQANVYADSVGLDNRCMDFSSQGQYKILEALNEINPDIIVTTIHKILIEPIVSRFSARLINLHYSLLPAFGGVIGMNPVQNAIDYGAKFTGVTAHFVTNDVDKGKPIAQAVIPLSDDRLESISSVVFKSGCLALITAIQIIQSDFSKSEYKSDVLVNIGHKNCFFSEISMSESEMNRDEIWSLIESNSNS
jgi:phosphoribosylglycinamide formyltransferase-1